MSWNFQREESNGFELIPVGEHRVRIESADKSVSKNGKEMIIMKLAVSGYSASIWHYIVFLPETPEITNRNITQVLDSFDIPDSEVFNLAKWAGKVGACRVKHETYNEEVTAKVNYFIHKRKQGVLPAWKEVGSSSSSKPTELRPVVVNSDDDLPF